MNLNEMWDEGKTAMQITVETMPRRQNGVVKPWITQSTLDLLDWRSRARAANDKVEEKRLLKEVRKACKHDKTAWVDAQISSGSWDALKRHCRPKPRRQGRLKDMSGGLVDSTQRADTMAEYLEKVQWQVRVAQIVDDDPVGDPLPVLEAHFTAEEVSKTAFTVFGLGT